MHDVNLYKTCKEKRALAFYKWLSSLEVKFSRGDYTDLTDLISSPGFLSDSLSTLSDSSTWTSDSEEKQRGSWRYNVHTADGGLQNRSDGCMRE